MPFNFSETLNKFVGSDTVNNILLSPIWVSIMITTVILFVIYLLIRKHIKSKTNLTYLISKLGVYTLLFVSGMIFLHFQMLNKKATQVLGSREIEKIVAPKYQDISSVMNNTIEIKPKLAMDEKKIDIEHTSLSDF